MGQPETLGDHVDRLHLDPEHARFPPTLQERNVAAHLPERDRPAVKRKLRAAWALESHEAATGRLEALVAELARSHPGAAASLGEGLAETLTVTRLGRVGRSSARCRAPTPASR